MYYSNLESVFEVRSLLVWTPEFLQAGCVIITPSGVVVVEKSGVGERGDPGPGRRAGGMRRCGGK